MTSADTTTTGSAPPPVGRYPHARRVGRFIFLSGLGPRDPAGGPIPGVTLDGRGRVVDHDIEAQTLAVFDNVRRVLEAAGSRWERLIDVTVFLTDMERDFETFNRLWNGRFPDNAPCRTTVEVNRLPTPIAIELKCIALIDEDD
ncbi:MAG: RidA family protein [Gammaproteobacteria bacterium]